MVWKKRLDEPYYIVKEATIEAWVTCFLSCHNAVETGWNQWSWPDGMGFYNQPNAVVEVFGLIKSVLTEQQERKRDLERKKR